MSILRYHPAKEIFLSVKGHPLERDALCDVFESFDNYAYTMVEQPAAQHFFTPNLAEKYDAFVLYDMPGLDFLAEAPPAFVPPSNQFKQGFLDLLNAGKGFVFLHHAIAGWPAWDEYGEIIGGRFYYKSHERKGEQYLDSGYRHKVKQTVSVLEEHPVTYGIPQHFSLTDELYLYEVFEDNKIPLLASDFTFSKEHFFSAHHAVNGRMNCNENWEHEKGSSLIGWIKSYDNSPIVYLQCGDDAQTFANENFRQLLKNAIDWVSSDEAHSWARSRNDS